MSPAGKAGPLPQLRGLLPYLRRHRRGLRRGLVFLLATTALSVLSPWVLRHAIDDLTLRVTQEKLLLYAAAIVGVVLVEGVFRYYMRLVLIGPIPGLPSRISRVTLSHPRTTLSSRPAGTVGSVSSHFNCTSSPGIATRGTKQELKGAIHDMDKKARGWRLIKVIAGSCC